MIKPIPHLLSLELAKRFEPLAEELGVSEVARSERGFFTAYKQAGGDWNALDPWWQNRRNNFVKRHMAQVEMRNEPLFYDNGTPTRRHLGLIMWAHSPLTEKQLEKTMRRKNPLLPGDFFGFDTFDTEDEDTEHIPTLRDTLQRGDVIRAGGSRWTVVRSPKGSFTISLYKFPSKKRKMYRMALGEDVWEIHEINGLGDNIAFIAKGHPDDITVEEAAGLVQLGDRRSNPQKRWPRGSRIQTLIFDRDMFTPAQAKNWAVDNEFKTSKVDLQPNTIRLRQIAPSRFDSRYGFRTIQITDGVQATVGVPLE